MSTIPTKTGLPLIGNAYDYLFRPIQFREECAEEFNGIVRADAGPMNMYVVTNSRYAREILIRDDNAFSKPKLMKSRLGQAFGNGLLTSDGELWRQNRKLSQPVFRPSQLEEEISTIVRCGQKWLDERSTTSVENISKSAEKLFIDVVVQTLFQTDVDYMITTRNVSDALVKKYKTDMLPFFTPSIIPTPFNREYKSSLAAFDQVLESIIDERMKQERSNNDLLSILLTAYRRGTLTRKQVKDEITTFILGGSGTPSLVFTFALSLIGQSRSMQQRLADEAELILINENTSLETLDELEYTEKVLKETMRLYPPVWLLGREATKPVNIGEFEFEEGAIAHIVPWTIHRDKQYFDNPETFNPSRWTKDLENELPSTAFMPFAVGSRQCIGKQMAMIELKILLAMAVREYQFEFVPESGIEVAASTHLVPENTILNIEKR